MAREWNCCHMTQTKVGTKVAKNGDLKKLNSFLVELDFFDLFTIKSKWRPKFSMWFSTIE